MLNKDLTLVRTLLSVRDINQFASEFLTQNLYHFNDKGDQHIFYTLSSNLHRAAELIESELSTQGFHCKERIYSHHAFKNVKYLDADLVAVVKKYIQKKKISHSTEFKY